MKIPKRWLFWGSGLFLGIIVLGAWYASQPIAGEMSSAGQGPPSFGGPTAAKTTAADVAVANATAVDRTSPSAQKQGQDRSRSPDITVSEEEIDRVIDEALAFLDRLAERGANAEERFSGGGQDETEMGEVAGENASMPGDAEQFEVESDVGEIPEPEQVVEEFITALQSFDLDTLTSMARGQARDKLEELRDRMSNVPPAAMMMLQSVQPVNGRRISEDEFRFNLQVPGGQGSPEIVLRYDGGQWWIDEIID